MMHGNIMKYCRRPFSSPEEMTNVLIDNTNKLVRPNDTLWSLGDFAFKNHQVYRNQIKCKNIHLITGNHDNLPHGQLKEIFSSVRSLRRVKIGYKGESVHVVLCHYAMRVWDLSHHGSTHLYGHSHGTLPDDPHMRSMDVGVDAIALKLGGMCYTDAVNLNLWGNLKQENYRPVSIDEIIEFMKDKQFKPIDHHNKETT